MNAITTDPVSFAVSLVEGRSMDVRQRIFATTDADLLRSTLDLIEEQDGDEMLRSWLQLRIRVLAMMQHAERVAEGTARPMERRGGTYRERRPAPAVQTSFLATPTAPAADPLDVQSVVGLPGPLLQPVTDPDLGTLSEDAPAVLEETAQPCPLVDPRPAVWVPVPRTEQGPSPFVQACLETVPALFWLLRRWVEGIGVQLHQRDLARLVRVQAERAGARWALSRWHRTAWAEGSPAETMAAALGLRVHFDRRMLTITDAASEATGPPISALA